MSGGAGLDSPFPQRVAAERNSRSGWARAVFSEEILGGVVKLADVAIVLSAAASAYFAYPIMYLKEGYYNFDRYALATVVAAFAFMILLDSSNAYDPRRLRDLKWQIAKMLVAWSIVCAIGLMVGFATKTSDNYSRGWVLSWCMATPAILIFERVWLDRQLAAWRRQGRFARMVAIVGAGESAARVVARLRQSMDDSVQIVGVFDDRRTRVAADVFAPGRRDGCSLAGTVDDLMGFARERRLDEIILAFPLSAGARLQALTERLKHLPVDLRVSLEPLAEHISIRGASWIGVLPLVNVADRPLKNWEAVVKFVEDKFLAALLLALFSLPMLLIAIAIKLDSRGPVFFVQERFGFNNARIRVHKFRTMHVDRSDPSGAEQTLRDDPRVTRLGRWLRPWSLDELPQLFDVLSGGMSLIGPRAHALKMKAAGTLYYEAIDEYFMRHRVKPGLTGWAQVHGLRGETDTLDKARLRLEYDLWYIDNWSFWLDVAIVLRTVAIILKRQNAY
jgi:Undecaprenyl-phosphate glucose phosphotransferase